MPRRRRSAIYKEILSRAKVGSKKMMTVPKTSGGKKGRRRTSTY